MLREELVVGEGCEDGAHCEAEGAREWHFRAQEGDKAF